MNKNLKKEIDTNIFDCNICFNSYCNENKATVLNCGHTFCNQCTNKCKICPYCKITINTKIKIEPNTTIGANEIVKIIESDNYEKKLLGIIEKNDDWKKEIYTNFQIKITEITTL